MKELITLLLWEILIHWINAKLLAKQLINVNGLRMMVLMIAEDIKTPHLIFLDHLNQIGQPTL